MLGRTSMNKEDSALSLDAHVYLHDIEKADILVGIPSFNNVLTASYVLSQVTKGLDTSFPTKPEETFKAIIILPKTITPAIRPTLNFSFNSFVKPKSSNTSASKIVDLE